VNDVIKIIEAVFFKAAFLFFCYGHLNVHEHRCACLPAGRSHSCTVTILLSFSPQIHLQNQFGEIIVSRKVAKIISRKVHSLHLCFLAPLRENFFA
jgi:hypothetical protein